MHGLSKWWNVLQRRAHWTVAGLPTWWCNNCRLELFVYLEMGIVPAKTFAWLGRKQKDIKDHQSISKQISLICSASNSCSKSGNIMKYIPPWGILQWCSTLPHIQAAASRSSGVISEWRREKPRRWNRWLERKGRRTSCLIAIEHGHFNRYEYIYIYI